jgi:hypothetical protein
MYNKMAPITKAQAKEILAYVLTKILEDDKDDGTPGPLQLAFIKAKVKGILGITSMSASVLDKLAWRNVLENVDVPLENGEIGLIKTFRAYIYYRNSINDAIDSYKKWLSITLEQFQRFRISKEWFSISENTGKLITAPSSNTSYSRDPTAEFKRGIKRNISMFLTLKQDKQWDVWQRDIFAQDVPKTSSKFSRRPMCPSFLPTDLFSKKNKSICTPFSNVHYYPTKERHSFVNIPSTMMPKPFSRISAHTPYNRPRPLSIPAASSPTLRPLVLVMEHGRVVHTPIYFTGKIKSENMKILYRKRHILSINKSSLCLRTPSLVSQTCDKYRYKQHTTKFVRVNLLPMINTCPFSFLVR